MAPSPAQRLDDGRPGIVLLDDLPVNSKVGNDGSERRVSRRSYFVLGAATVEWPDHIPTRPDDRHTKLRLLRAFPTNGTEAWKLLFAELGYLPGESEPPFRAYRAPPSTRRPSPATRPP